ncbi:Oxidoreductase [Pseudomonas sp. IT-P74]|uniref:hypothetical protein n=1 Tax=Pseudomonas sp. IT-P74 TaxID=3026445 RepID=UPI0039E0882F
MSELVEVSFSLDETLATLKPYQKNTIEQLIEKYGEEGAAQQWLAASGVSGTEKFGGERLDSRPFWDSLSYEFQLFICGDKKYKSDREKLMEYGKPTAALAVTFISGLIAGTLGIAAAAITPVISILLAIVSKMTANAWCATRVGKEA